MKAQPYDRVRTLVDMPGDFSKRVIPKGTEGAVVEAYDKPEEGYAVDVHILDENEPGGYVFDNIILMPDQFEVMEEYRSI